MRAVIFCHSLISDWNHGNAHFLRGITAELLERGHDVSVYEPRDSWSLKNLLTEQGFSPVERLFSAYPWFRSNRYEKESLDLENALDGADLVIVHEWNEHWLVKRIGELRRESRSFKLLFHDTHHRSVSEPDSMASYDLSDYDGVLAFGEVIRDIYIRRSWAQRAWTWHEAADTRVFYPREREEKNGDLVWIGNWGDGERSAELNDFLISPARALKLKARIHGVRYPTEAVSALKEAGLEYAGWLPNFDVPKTFSEYKLTVHVPRRPYVRLLPGIPTIRVFEALACSIPLVSAPWDDTENLFRPGRDFLTARSGKEMERHLKDLVNDAELREAISSHGRKTILKRHTCSHRVDELLDIYKGLRQ